MKKILVVQGEGDGQCYIIDHLANRWQAMDFEISISRGVEDLPSADIAILHVDKTIVPHGFYDALADYPVVINHNVLDISRRHYSQIILSQDTDYTGPVIIKTNANYGGVPEYDPKARKRPSEYTWIGKKVLDPKKYPIFNSPQEVPLEAWKNPHLIIEQFRPEKEGELFFVRYWSFFGDRSSTGRYGSKDPIAKFSNMVTDDVEVEIPADLIEARQAIGIDFGRFDFVVHDGQTILLDVNKTLGAGSTAIDSYNAYLDNLAQGIYCFVQG